MSEIFKIEKPAEHRVEIIRKKTGRQAFEEMYQEKEKLPENIIKIIEKILEGKKIKPKEQSLVSKFRSQWWKEKYGVSFEQSYWGWGKTRIKKRNAEKLAELEKRGKDRFFVDFLRVISDFLERMRRLDVSEMKLASDNLKKQYPKHSAEIDALFVVPSKEIFNIKQLPTEWIVNATKAVYQNKDKNEIRRFWERFRVMREIFGKKFKEVEKKGVTGQVAMMRILNELGFDTTLATPEEDAYESTDLWIWMPTDLVGGKEDFPIVEMGIPVQVKTVGREETTKKVGIAQDDIIHYPAIQIFSEKLPRNADVFVSAEQLDSVPHIAETVETKEKRAGKKVFALRVKIPYRQDFVDLDTGKPTKKCVGEAKKEFEKICNILEK